MPDCKVPVVPFCVIRSKGFCPEGLAAERRLDYGGDSASGRRVAFQKPPENDQLPLSAGESEDHSLGLQAASVAGPQNGPLGHLEGGFLRLRLQDGASAMPRLSDRRVVFAPCPRYEILRGRACGCLKIARASAGRRVQRGEKIVDLPVQQQRAPDGSEEPVLGESPALLTMKSRR